jgi:hypothetical protein
MCYWGAAQEARGRLEVDMALSRVGIATIQRKSGGKVREEYVLSAKFLREHYQKALEFDNALRAPLEPKPEDPFLASLWELGNMVRKERRPMTERKRARIERLLSLLDRYIQGIWTQKDAGRLQGILLSIK